MFHGLSQQRMEASLLPSHTELTLNSTNQCWHYIPSFLCDEVYGCQMFGVLVLIQSQLVQLRSIPQAQGNLVSQLAGHRIARGHKVIHQEE